MWGSRAQSSYRGFCGKGKTGRSTGQGWLIGLLPARFGAVRAVPGGGVWADWAGERLAGCGEVMALGCLHMKGVLPRKLLC